MKELRLKTKQDIEDFLAGCAFYGTGGGGDVAIGRASLNSCLDRGLDIALKDPYDMKDDETYCCAFFMGSIAPKDAGDLSGDREDGLYSESIRPGRYPDRSC